MRDLTSRVTWRLGEINRHKTRCAVKGHKGNMQKGTHFTETFAATPREDTGRIMSALFVLCNLLNMTCDVEKAYCWADVPPGELIAIRYPPGLKYITLRLKKSFIAFSERIYTDI
jgi:hypothetical protein